MLPFFDNKIGLWAHVTSELAGHLHEIKTLGFGYLVVKIADGAHAYDHAALPGVLAAAASIDLPVIFWAYVYPENIDAQVKTLAALMEQLGTDAQHLILDAEAEWEKDGTGVVAEQLCHGIAEATGHTVTLHLSSFYVPSYHPKFPYEAFLKHCSSWMPQAYSEGANPPLATIITRAAHEGKALSPNVIPTINTPGLLKLLRTAGFSCGSVWLYDGVFLPAGEKRKPGDDPGVRHYETAWRLALEAFRSGAPKPATVPQIAQAIPPPKAPDAAAAPGKPAV